MSPEDEKLVTLARATGARLRCAEAAAVRDSSGRTYAAAAVTLPSLRLTALESAVAMAVASGAERLEAAALVTAGVPAAPGVLTDLGASLLLVAGPDGRVVEQRRLGAGLADGGAGNPDGGPER